MKKALFVACCMLFVGCGRDYKPCNDLSVVTVTDMALPPAPPDLTVLPTPDLSPPPYCGDGLCADTETCSSCPTDCGECPPPTPVCGDGVCNGEETCSSCPCDCGQCPP